MGGRARWASVAEMSSSRGRCRSRCRTWGARQRQDRHGRTLGSEMMLAISRKGAAGGEMGTTIPVEFAPERPATTHSRPAASRPSPTSGRNSCWWVCRVVPRRSRRHKAEMP